MANAEPSPPASLNAAYQNLHATALEFIHSQDVDDSQAARIDETRIRAIRTSSYTASWGHNHFVSTKPALQGSHNTDAFLKHLNTMIPMLESWNTHVTDVVVDEVKKTVVVRASYWMKVKGADESIENDMIWWLIMDEDGEKVERSLEFVDGIAGGRIAEVMRGAQK